MLLRLMFQIGIICALIGGSSAWARFPEVSSVVQADRDMLRRDILTAELNAEEAGWAKADTALAAEPTEPHRADLHRHTQNIEALRRELGPLRHLAAFPPQVVSRAGRAHVLASERERDAAPFWDPYRRIASPSFPTDQGSGATVSSTTAKETP